MQDAAARRLRDDEHDGPPPASRGLRLVEDASAPAERRTITITGRPTPARRRSSQAAERISARPDRVALWAFLLGLFMMLMAVATANAAPL